MDKIVVAGGCHGRRRTYTRSSCCCYHRQLAIIPILTLCARGSLALPSSSLRRFAASTRPGRRASPAPSTLHGSPTPPSFLSFLFRPCPPCLERFRPISMAPSSSLPRRDAIAKDTNSSSCNSGEGTARERKKSTVTSEEKPSRGGIGSGNRSRRGGAKSVTTAAEALVASPGISTGSAGGGTAKKEGTEPAKSNLSLTPKSSKSGKEAAASVARVVGTSAATASKEPVEKKAKKPPPHQVLTERDELPRLWNPNKSSLVGTGSYPMRIVSWNVCGLRALLAKSPDALKNLVKEYDADVLCLQETKLQTSHVVELGLEKAIPGYDGYFSCSMTKKGYSGTAAFVRRRAAIPPPSAVASVDSASSSSREAPGNDTQNRRKKQKTLDGFFKSNSKMASAEKAVSEPGDTPAEMIAGAVTSGQDEEDSLPIELARILVPERVSYSTGTDKHDSEGRVVILEFPRFTLCNVYVPNSGQALARLSYRVDEWDKDWLRFCANKRQSTGGRPLLWLGDLNVAHTHLEVWNDGAKHLPKQAGVTPEERASFQHQLDSGYVDAFRHLHPGARGHYSYWSQRAGNRPPNKGLRLDYFVCDPSFFPEMVNGSSASSNFTGATVVRDSYMLPDVQGSDHCPVVLEMEVKL